MLHFIIMFILLCIALGLIGTLSYSITRYIKKSDYISSTHYGELVQLLQDKHELHRYGFGQYLKRSYSDFNAFHMSFMHMGMMVSMLFLSYYLFNYITISFALILFLILALFYIINSVAIGRLLSGQPTAGGLYHVLLREVGSLWASFVGVIKLFSQLATTLLYSYIFSMLGLIVLLPIYPHVIQPLYIILGMVFCIATQAIIANLRSSITRWVQGIGILLFWSLLVSISIAVLIVVLPSGYSPFYFLVGEVQLITTNQSGIFIPVAVSLIILARCFVGHDEVAANAEETIEPKIKIPWANYLATSYSAIFGFVFLIIVGILYFNVTDATYTSYSTMQWLEALALLPSSLQVILFLFFIVIAWYNGLFSVVNGSRHVMAMARDSLLPYSNVLATITLIRQTPHRAILLYAILAAGFSLIVGFSSGRTDFILELVAVSVGGYSLIYSIALLLTLTKHETTTLWSFSRGVRFVHTISLLFNVVMVTVSYYFLNWIWLTVILSIAAINMLYTYLSKGYVKMQMYKALNKQEAELERHFPLQ